MNMGGMKDGVFEGDDLECAKRIKSVQNLVRQLERKIQMMSNDGLYSFEIEYQPDPDAELANIYLNEIFEYLKKLMEKSNKGKQTLIMKA